MPKHVRLAYVLAASLYFLSLTGWTAAQRPLDVSELMQPLAPYDTAFDDLEAQERMAAAAEEGVRLNTLQSWLLGFTFLISIVAAIFAAQSANAARKSTELVAKAERAWISFNRLLVLKGRTFNGMSGKDEVGGLRFQCEYLNRGHTPAQNFRHQYEFRIVPSNADINTIKFEWDDKIDSGTGTWHPGQSIISTEANLMMDRIGRLHSDRERLILWTCIKYEDVFSKETRVFEHCGQVRFEGDPRRLRDIEQPIGPYDFSLVGFPRYNNAT